MTTEGLKLLIDSSQAADGARQFQSATELAAKAAESVDVRVDRAEKTMARFGAMSARAARAMQTGARDLSAISATSRQTEQNTAALVTRFEALSTQLLQVAENSRKAGAAVGSGIPEGARRAAGGFEVAGRFAKQLGTSAIGAVTGITGLGQAMTAIPALAIASAIGALTAKILSFSDAAEVAEERQRKLVERSEEYRASLERLGALAREREIQAILGTAPADKSGLQAQADAIKVLLADFDRLKREAPGALQLDLGEQLKSLRVPPEVIRDIDAITEKIRAQREFSQQKVVVALGGGRDRFQQDVKSVVGRDIERLQKDLPSLRLKFDGLDAKLALDPDALRADLEKQLAAIQKQVGEVPFRVQAVADDQRQQVDLLGKEASERERILRIRQQEDSLRGLSGAEAEAARRQFDEINKLADAKQREIEAAATAKRLADDEAKARDRAAQQAADAARDLQQQRDRLVDLIERKRDEVALLQVEGAERDKLRAKLEAQRTINEAGNVITADQVRLLNELADAEGRAIQAAADATRQREDRNRAEQEATRITRERQQAAEQEARDTQRRTEFLRTIEQEIDLLRASAEERKKLAVTFEAENKARELGIDLMSTEGKKLQEQIAARARLTEEEKKANDARDQVAQLGADVGASIGEGLLAAAKSGGKLRDILKGIYQDLIQIAGRKLVVESLSRAGSALFGGTTASLTGNVFGAPVRPAQVGVVSSFGALRMGDGRLTSVSEGGGTTLEVVAPLVRDRRGRLGLSVGGGGGTNVTQNIVLPNVRSARDARAVGATMRQTIAAMNAAQQRQRHGMRGQ